MTWDTSLKVGTRRTGLNPLDQYITERCSPDQPIPQTSVFGVCGSSSYSRFLIKGQTGKSLTRSRGGRNA